MARRVTLRVNSNINSKKCLSSEVCSKLLQLRSRREYASPTRRNLLLNSICENFNSRVFTFVSCASFFIFVSFSPVVTPIPFPFPLIAIGGGCPSSKRCACKRC